MNWIAYWHQKAWLGGIHAAELRDAASTCPAG